MYNDENSVYVKDAFVGYATYNCSILVPKIDDTY